MTGELDSLEGDAVDGGVLTIVYRRSLSLAIFTDFSHDLCTPMKCHQGSNGRVGAAARKLPTLTFPLPAESARLTNSGCHGVNSYF